MRELSRNHNTPTMRQAQEKQHEQKQTPVGHEDWKAIETAHRLLTDHIILTRQAAVFKSIFCPDGNLNPVFKSGLAEIALKVLGASSSEKNGIVEDIISKGLIPAEAAELIVWKVKGSITAGVPSSTSSVIDEADLIEISRTLLVTRAFYMYLSETLGNGIEAPADVSGQLDRLYFDLCGFDEERYSVNTTHDEYDHTRMAMVFGAELAEDFTYENSQRIAEIVHRLVKQRIRDFQS